MQQPSRVDPHDYHKEVECQQKMHSFQQFNHSIRGAAVQIIDIQNNSLNRTVARPADCRDFEQLAEILEILPDLGNRSMLPVITGFGSSQYELGKVSTLVDLVDLGFDFAHSRVRCTELFGSTGLFRLESIDLAFKRGFLCAALATLLINQV